VAGKALTLAARGFRMPAEWEPHRATWIGWPHNTTDWPGKFATIPWVYGEITRRLAEGEIVETLVESGGHAASARRVLDRVGADLTRIRFHKLSTDRGWTRDSGPAFLVRENGRPSLAAATFAFNGWAKYSDWKKDRRLARFAGERAQAELFDPGIVLEGGSIDVNGRGTLVTTEECLLDASTQVRNPGLDRAAYERVFRDILGIRNVLWLGRGIVGDDTHGHVDDLCRFVSATTLAACRETDPHDANYEALEENRERLEDMRLEDGSKPAIVFLPMPAPLVFDGRRLPASYANFYIANAAVLVPTFNDPMDRVALGILSDVFSDRPVVGIHAVDLVWGLGTIHCLTRQEPAVARS
jgi:agmatine deiminase